jgi:hypothetical protein
VRLVHSGLKTGIDRFRAQALEINSYVVQYTNFHVKIIRGSEELKPCPCRKVYIQERKDWFIFFSLHISLYPPHLTPRLKNEYSYTCTPTPPPGLHDLF